MEENLDKLHDDLMQAMGDAPDMKDWTYLETEMYETMSSLIEAMECAGYGQGVERKG